MADRITRLRCSGCGAEAPEDEPLPFQCANATGGDDIDHVLRRELADASASSPANWRATFLDDEPNPFVRYRALLHGFNVGLERGLDDASYVEMVRSLDRAVESVAGVGFRETPFSVSPALNRALGRSGGAVWIKDETGSVSGTHKARHLSGIMLWIEMARRTGLIPESEGRSRFAIASCGNAALAAAVVAKAAGETLDVFIPTDANPNVTEQLSALGATLAVCERQGGMSGDPCVLEFRKAVGKGGLPFSVQGNENGLALEGGLTLGWEIVSALIREKEKLDRIFIQVGGGALASSCAQALRECMDLGLLSKVPRIHAVQTSGGYPLRRAWERVVARILGGEATSDDPTGSPLDDDARAKAVAEDGMATSRREALRYAVTHRSEFMWPWETVPHSAAHGILDDETYDWHALAEAMIETGGYPIVASEEEVLRANELAHEATTIPVDHTGTAGLAGLLRVVRSGAIGDDESVAVLFTGRER